MGVSEQEKQDVEEAAAALGISVSRFSAQAVLHGAELVLAGARGRLAPERRGSIYPPTVAVGGEDQAAGSGSAAVGPERRARGIVKATEQVVVSQQEKRVVDEAARVLGITTSRLARRAVSRDAQLVLAGFRACPWAEGLRFRRQRILEVLERHGGGPASLG